jgi:hypothetical protein
MTPPTPRAVGRRLRRLDRAGLARFVAALWAASGWSAAVEDGRVVAHRAPPSRQRRVLAVVTGLRDALFGVDGEADLLVAPVGEREARVLAARTGLGVVDADELHERLVYGVDEEAREHLLAEFVPAPRPGPSRRAVLSALAGGGAVAAVAGVAARGPGSLPVVSRFLSPGSTAVPEATGTASATTAQDTETGAATTAGPTLTAGCNSSPEETISQQISAFRRQLAGEEGSDARATVAYDFADPTDLFVDAVERAGVDPFRNAVSVDVGTAIDQGTVAAVPVTVVTDAGEEVLYEFTLSYTRAGCWRTAGAELVVRRTPEASVGQV